MQQGYLTVTVSAADEGYPIQNARVYIKTRPQTGSAQSTSYSNVSPNFYDYYLTTNASGKTGSVRIDTPNSENSLNQNSTQMPYSVVDAYIETDGYFPLRIQNIQIFGGNQSNLPVSMIPLGNGYAGQSGGVITYTVPPNQLLLPDTRTQEGFTEGQVTPFIADDIYIPETVVVHLGAPSSNAQNVSVPFTEYIKNVASSEIFPTWPENSLRANIYAIISLTLNRFFTEWYRSQGYDFDITSSTGFDQAFVPGRNIFDNISRIVDEIFNTYVARQGNVNPLFTQFCDGREVQCAGLSQWGTVDLANQGYTPLQILRYYYGNDIELMTTDDIDSAQSSYPGRPLQIGDSGEDVLEFQRRLMRIRQNYPAISAIPTIDGNFRASTDAAVRDFQEIFNLDVDGIVGKATWYKVSFIYSAVTKLAELEGEGLSEIFLGDVPDVTTQFGDTGNYVLLLQLMLNYASNFYPTIPRVERDGVFGAGTQNALRAFQRTFGLAETGIATPEIWDIIFQVVLYILSRVAIYLPEQGYPGSPLTPGDRNNAVKLMQDYLNALTSRYPNIQRVDADGVFGPATQRAVLAFQEDFALPRTGQIDAATWERIVEIYNFSLNEPMPI